MFVELPASKISGVPYLEYVSTGCNPAPHALDWGKNDKISYGACNSVALYVPERPKRAGRVEAVLNGHSGRVNCVRWIECCGSEDAELISGSSDKNIILWKNSEGGWRVHQVLSGHSNAVCDLSVICLYEGEAINGNLIIASASADSSVKIWMRQKDQDAELKQTLTYGSGFVLALALGKLPGPEDPLLVCGADDTRVLLYTFDRSSRQFVFALGLHGHEDWVRCLALVNIGDAEMLLASGAQDAYVRLWRISKSRSSIAVTNELVVDDQKIKAEGQEYCVVLESVLIGHEGWVMGVCWNASSDSLPCLLTASMDKTMIIWQLDESEGVWIDKVRMGEVGGNTLGFYGCAFSPSGKSILSHGYQGAFHLWEESESHGNMISSTWRPCITVSGHFGPVEDLAWEPRGEFLVSVSADQTTRVHAPWRRNSFQDSWHEIARPQIHGYNMTCLAMLSRYRFVSGAEEKVARVFEAPRAFHESFMAICKVDDSDEILASLPLGASVPALGLSNKAVFEGDIRSWSDQAADEAQPLKASAYASEDPAPFKPMLVSTPPVEDVLLQNTLWPETQKLYGHGYEIFCLASTRDGSLLASACKATKADHANILLWNTASWKQVSSLSAHSLTVTQMEFSPNDQYLLTVSRDRTWSLFKQSQDCASEYKLAARTDKKTCIHSRIIWSCSWLPCGSAFVTASRDKKVILWNRENIVGKESWNAHSSVLDIDDSATAVAVAPLTLESRHVIAVGTESGGILVYSFKDSLWSLDFKLSSALCPSLTVKRLAWRPPLDHSEGTMRLVACSSDHSVRILSIPQARNT